MRGTCLWRNCNARIVTTGRCIRSGLRRTPVCGATRIGRYTGLGWRTSPVSGAIPFLPRNRRRSSRIGSDACPATGSLQRRHSRTGCRWRGSTAMSATSRMHASNHRTTTVSGVTHAKCCCSNRFTNRPGTVRAATFRTGGPLLHHADGTMPVFCLFSGKNRLALPCKSWRASRSSAGWGWSLARIQGVRYNPA